LCRAHQAGADVDAELAGFRRVVTSYGRETVHRVAS
jgi:hypothetical protein